MKIAIVGNVTADDLELADLFGITSVTSFITNDVSPLPPTMNPPREIECIPLERMVDEHVALKQNHFRLLQNADALVCQGETDGHLVKIARSYDLPIMELP